MLLAFSCSAQKQERKAGILVLEDEFELFFFPTKQKSLKTFFSKSKDTIVAYSIDAATITNYQDYLKRSIRFDSLITVTSKLSSEQKVFEDTSILYWKAGNIVFEKPNFTLAVRNKMVYYKKKKIPVKIFNYLLVEKFETD